jgi:Iron/zinc purple acid phosphatase-like protein C
VTVPYIVAGNGGYHDLHTIATDAAAAGLPFAMPNYTGVTLENFDDDNYGYLRLRVTATAVTVEYVAVSPPGGISPSAIEPQVQDSVTIAVPNASGQPLPSP